MVGSSASEPMLHPGGRPAHWTDAQRKEKLANLRLKAYAAQFKTKPHMFGTGTRKTAKDENTGNRVNSDGHAMNATGAGASWLYRMLNPHSRSPQSRFYRRTISLVILVNVVAFIVSTDKTLNAYDEYSGPFYWIELISSCVFLVEYYLRLYTCTESTRYRALQPGEDPGLFPWRGWFWGRLRFMVSLNAVLDAVATFPAFLELMIQKQLPTFTYLRIFRLFRILKTERYFHAVECVWRIIYFNSEILMVSLFVCLMLLLVTATLMYYMRPQNCDDACMENFASIPRTLYLAVLMLTGQGGPEGTLDATTKIVCSLTAIFSVAVFAIPASMLTWGFEAEAERLLGKKREHRKRVEKAKAEGRDYVSSSNTSEEDASGNSSWDEYEAVILGDEAEKEAEEEQHRQDHGELMAIMRRVSSRLDKAVALEEDGAKEKTGVKEKNKGGGLQGDVNNSPELTEKVKKLEEKMESMHGLLLKVAQQMGCDP